MLPGVGCPSGTNRTAAACTDPMTPALDPCGPGHHHVVLSTDTPPCVNCLRVALPIISCHSVGWGGGAATRKVSQSEIYAQVRITFLCAGAHKGNGNVARQAENTPPRLAVPARRRISPEPLGGLPRQARILPFFARETGVPPQGAAKRKSTKNRPGLGNFRGRGKKSLQKISGVLDPRFPPGPAHTKKVQIASGHPKNIQRCGL